MFQYCKTNWHWNNEQQKSQVVAYPLTVPTRNAFTLVSGTTATGSSIIYNITNPTNTSLTIYCVLREQTTFTGFINTWLLTLAY